LFKLKIWFKSAIIFAIIILCIDLLMIYLFPIKIIDYQGIQFSSSILPLHPVFPINYLVKLGIMKESFVSILINLVGSFSLGALIGRIIENFKSNGLVYSFKRRKIGLVLGLIYGYLGIYMFSPFRSSNVLFLIILYLSTITFYFIHFLIYSVSVRLYFEPSLNIVLIFNIILWIFLGAGIQELIVNRFIKNSKKQ